MSTPRQALERVRTLIAAAAPTVAAHPLVARARVLATTRPRQVRLGLVGGALAAVVLVGFVSCAVAGARAPAGGAAVPTFGAPADPGASADPGALVSPGTGTNTDGCHGLVSAAQVSKAAGFEVTGSGGDAAAAVGSYAEAVRGQGLDATVRLCPFAGPGGDQVYVMAMTFTDGGQADQMYASGNAGLKPLPGVGEKATTDGTHTLLARRGRSVVLVYLVRVAEPNGDHTGALRAVALAALAKV